MLSSILEGMIVSVKKNKAQLDQILKEGDEMTLLPSASDG